MNAHQQAVREGAAEQAGERPPVKDIAKETFREFTDDDVPGMAAEIAYHAVFAIPPFIVFLVALAAVVNNFTTIPVAENLITVIEERAPADMQEMLTTLVQNAVDQVGGAASIGLLTAAAIALWSGSNGVATLMKGFNRAYDVAEERSFVRKKVVAIGLTALISVLIVAAFALFVFGEQIGSFIAGQVGLGGAFMTTWQILRWPMAIVFIMFLLAVLYYLGPNVEQSFRWISPGSVVATLIWVVIVMGFNLYLALADPGSAYGALGSVVVLLFFLYLTGIAFMVGAEVNAVLGKRYDPETIEDLAQHPEKNTDAEHAAAAEQRARNLDEREGTQTAPRRTSSHRRGFGARVATGAGSLAAALVLSRLRRRGKG
jgi:membrane protein